MNKSESKYFNTAKKFDEALINLLDKKPFEYVTIKEICDKAGVNRSTFYLHYENLDDLLVECNEYIINKFTNSMGGQKLTHYDINQMPIDKLKFITPEYLLPWLEFIKNNKKLFRTYVNKFANLTVEKNNKLLFNNVLYPILERFNVKDSFKPYLLDFYIEGVMALVKRWVVDDCKEDIDTICKLIISCVNYEKF